MTYGIQAFGIGGLGGDISVSGEGSLTIDSDMWGIHAYKHLEIDGASIFVEAHGRHALKSDADSISIKGGAHVEATSIGIESDSARDWRYAQAIPTHWRATLLYQVPEHTSKQRSTIFWWMQATAPYSRTTTSSFATAQR